MVGQDEKPSGLWFLDLEEREDTRPLEYDHSFDADADAPDRPWFVLPSTPPPPEPEEVQALLGPDEVDAEEVLVIEEYRDRPEQPPRRSRWLFTILCILGILIAIWAIVAVGGIFPREPGTREPGPGTEADP